MHEVILHLIKIVLYTFIYLSNLYYILGFHMTPKINKIFPESSLLIVVGVIIGIILYSKYSFIIAITKYIKFCNLK